jgi:hypothetical protein
MERQSGRKRVSTNLIALQVSKQSEIRSGCLRHTIVERWKKLNDISGGSIYGKSVIPFGKECGLGDTTMHHLVEQQNICLKATKQRIVANLDDIDELMDLDLTP